jgi:hypothetical protein
MAIDDENGGWVTTVTPAAPTPEEELEAIQPRRREPTDEELRAELQALGRPRRGQGQPTRQEQLTELDALGQPQPEVGQSELARDLTASGFIDEVGRRFALQRAEADRQALEQSQGFSASSITSAVSSFFNRSRDRFEQGIAGPLSAPPGAGWQRGILGGAGVLTPEQRRLAAEAENETATWMAPFTRGIADATPEISPDMRGPGLGVVGNVFRMGRGLVDAYAGQQEERLRRAQAMLRGEANLPEYAQWRSLFDTGVRTLPELLVAMPLRWAGAVSGSIIGTEGTETQLYQWGQQVERVAQRAFPGDPARQFEFAHSMAQGVASTMVFGGAGLTAQLLGAGPRGQLILIGLMGAAAESPNEYARITEALRLGNATERERIFNLILNSLGGASEMLPFMPHRAGRSRLGAMLHGGIDEGNQEGFQGVVRNLGRMEYDPTQNPYEDLLQSYAVAFTSGGVYHGIMPPPAATGANQGVTQARAGGGRSLKVSTGSIFKNIVKQRGTSMNRPKNCTTASQLMPRRKSPCCISVSNDWA